MQIQVWIALAGGAGALIGGVVGGIGGQWLHGAFGKQRAIEARAEDRWGYWRNHRLTAYSEFVAAVERWLTVVLPYQDWRRFGETGGRTLSSSDKNARWIAIFPVWLEIKDPYARVRTLGSDQYVTQADKLIDFLERHVNWLLLTSQDPRGGSAEDRETFDGVDEDAGDIAAHMLESLIVTSRVDLAVGQVPTP